MSETAFDASTQASPWPETLRLLGLLLLALILGDIVSLFLPDAPGWSTLRLLVSLLVAWGLIVGVQRQRGRRIGPFLGPESAYLVGLGLLSGVSLSLLGVSLLSHMPFPPPESMQALDEFMQSGWAVPRYAAMLLVAPFFEEVLFRGWLLRTWERRHARWVAIVVTAIPFALLHLAGWRVLIVLPLGLLFGWLAAGRRTLWPAMAAHLGANAAPMLTAPVLSLMGYAPAEIDALAAVPWIISLGAGIVFAYSVWIIHRRFSAAQHYRTTAAPPGSVVATEHDTDRSSVVPDE